MCGIFYLRFGWFYVLIMVQYFLANIPVPWIPWKTTKRLARQKVTKLSSTRWTNSVFLHLAVGRYSYIISVAKTVGFGGKLSHLTSLKRFFFEIAGCLSIFSTTPSILKNQSCHLREKKHKKTHLGGSCCQQFFIIDARPWSKDRSSCLCFSLDTVCPGIICVHQPNLQNPENMFFSTKQSPSITLSTTFFVPSFVEVSDWKPTSKSHIIWRWWHSILPVWSFSWCEGSDKRIRWFWMSLWQCNMCKMSTPKCYAQVLW